MKVKTSELKDLALDWAVAMCAGLSHKLHGHIPYSTDWAQGGPIIEREGISIVLDWDVVGEFLWGATRIEQSVVSQAEGTTPLIAAMRCYVASKLGDEVEIPDELKGESK